MQYLTSYMNRWTISRLNSEIVVINLKNNVLGRKEVSSITSRLSDVIFTDYGTFCLLSEADLAEIDLCFPCLEYLYITIR